MLITYILGFLSGFAIASFFLGKELYRFYLKNKVQGKQIERLRRFKNKNKKTESQSKL
jgi:uncharacterized membrane protein YdjX (TVP38/TMEM64 family)